MNWKLLYDQIASLQQPKPARSLCHAIYERNAGFLSYVERTGHPFHPHESFKRADLDERQNLYLRIAEEVWNPECLHQEATTS